jgi:hypothetical protein
MDRQGDLQAVEEKACLIGKPEQGGRRRPDKNDPPAALPRQCSQQVGFGGFGDTGYLELRRTLVDLPAQLPEFRRLQDEIKTHAVYYTCCTCCCQPRSHSGCLSIFPDDGIGMVLGTVLAPADTVM